MTTGLDTASYVPEATETCSFENGDFCSYDKSTFDLIYSRFTLHSINDEQQEQFLSSITKRGTFLAIECRSDGDVDTVREHGDDHYRNFVSYERMLRLFDSLGFMVLFAEEGRGFAPYKSEDPVCVRLHCGERLMAGNAERADKLNYTLNWVVDLFEKKGITDWFIGYGTLLGCN